MKIPTSLPWSVYRVSSTVLSTFCTNPSSDIRRNILDFSGVGVAVVPEVPRELTPNPVQFSLQEAVFFSQAGSEGRDSSLTGGWRDI